MCGLRKLKSTKPKLTSSMPPATVRLAPKRRVSRGVRGATVIMITAMGSSRTAVPSAL